LIPAFPKSDARAKAGAVRRRGSCCSRGGGAVGRRTRRHCLTAWVMPYIGIDPRQAGRRCLSKTRSARRRRGAALAASARDPSWVVGLDQLTLSTASACVR
jgi:hypothetical protein